MPKEIKEIEREMRSLEEQLEYHSRLYYELDSPIIQDEEYDALFQRLVVLEREFAHTASWRQGCRAFRNGAPRGTYGFLR